MRKIKDTKGKTFAHLVGKGAQSVRLRQFTDMARQGYMAHEVITVHHHAVDKHHALGGGQHLRDARVFHWLLHLLLFHVASPALGSG